MHSVNSSKEHEPAHPLLASLNNPGKTTKGDNFVRAEHKFMLPECFS